MILVEFDSAHLNDVDPLERNGRAKLEEFRKYAAQFSGFSLLDGDKAVGCGGLIPIHQHRAMSWSILSDSAPKVSSARLVREFLDLQDIFRIETVVDCADEVSQRWLRFLGFERETPPLEGYSATGAAVYYYARFCRGN